MSLQPESSGNLYDYHPSVQAIRHFDDDLADPGLLVYGQLNMPSEKYATAVLPGALQTLNYASHLVGLHTDRPAEVNGILAHARLGRLDRILSHDGHADFFVHDSIGQDRRFEGVEDIMANAIRHAVSLVEEVQTSHPGRVSLRVVEDGALRADDNRLTGIQEFAFTERLSWQGDPLRTVWLHDAVDVAGFWSDEQERAPQWLAALGELALPQQGSLDFLLSEADRLNPAR